LRVVVAAEESAGVQVLHRLAALTPQPEIVGVLTTAEGDAKRRALVYEAARALGLQTWPAELVCSPELAEQLRRFGVDLFLNVHSLFLVHPDVLAAARIGSFNLHPGPLPEYAGLNVPSWAIYNGEVTHAVTLHWMDEGIDTGPIAWLERFELSQAETGLSVSGKCVRLGVPLLVKLVETAGEDVLSIPRHQQDRSRRRYFPSGPPEEGRLDWARPAAEVLRFVRAADYAPFRSPWGHPQADLGSRRVGIAKAAPTGTATNEAPGTVGDIDDEGAVVATGDELVLVQRVWFDGRYLKPAELLAH
jgi:methionyl-tRNA formyltransferase